MATPIIIEQGRAKKAYEFAFNVNDKIKDKFKSHVKSFPMLVKTNGLGASFSFLFSKKDKEQGVYRLVAESFLEWLKYNDRYKMYGLNRINGIKEFVEDLVQLNSSHYRALTNEVMAYFTWLRRFAEGLDKS